MVLNEFDYKKHFGINIKRERIFRNLTVEDVANLIGCTPAFLRFMECGKRGVTCEKLIAFSKIFNTTTDYLLKPVDIHMPHVSEDEETEEKNREVKKRKIETLLLGLSSKELDFIVDNIRGIYAMKGEIIETSPNEEEGNDKDINY